MLTNRQLKILMYSYKNTHRYVTSREISNKLNVSSRTVLDDLNTLRKASKKFSSFTLESVSGKGTTLIINNINEFKNDLEILKGSDSKSKKAPKLTLLNHLIDILITTKNPVSKTKLLDKLFISEATFYNYLNQAKDTLSNFNLKIINISKRGYLIEGEEVNKRGLISNLNLSDNYPSLRIGESELSNIYNYIADIFLKYHYQINEHILQNLALHVIRTKNRLNKGHYINNYNNKIDNTNIEIKISRDILTMFLKNQLNNQKYFENEILFFSEVILGQSAYSQDKNIISITDNFMKEAFKKINNKFYINFDIVENLRYMMSLHISSLLFRIHTQSQDRSPLTSEVKKNFPQAYDLALYLSIMINDNFNLNVNNDEISYLALYFNFGLEKLSTIENKQKIIVVTKLRQSETILLNHRILNWFPNQVQEVIFISPYSYESYNKPFDIALTTEKYISNEKHGVTYINLFPNNIDFNKINLLLSGYTKPDDILKKFNEKCFFYVEKSDKSHFLTRVIDQATKQYKLRNDFKEKVFEREEIASTYIGNGIAAPHPLMPVTDDTFVSVGISKDPVLWDDKNTIQICILISIAKSNPKEFQFWYYLSEIFSSKTFTEELVRDSTFENLKQQIKIILDKKLI